MRLPSLLALIALTAACSRADNDATKKPAAPVAPAAATAPAPAPVVAVAPAKPTKINYAIPLTPIKQKDLNFNLYRNRWSFLFYFSPTCGHCQHTYPWIQKLRATYEKKGLAFAAIVSGSASQDDIRMFDTDFNLDMPVFQDATRKFGSDYGTGSVPLLVLVKPDGSYQTWVGSDDSTKAIIDASIKSGLHVK